MPTVFMCYCIHDARIAHRVAADLEREGVEVKLHGHDYRPWQPQPLGYDEALRDSDFILVLISAATQQIEWFCNACRDALADEARRGSNRIVLVMAEKVEQAPDTTDIEYVDISQSYSSGMAELLGLFGCTSSQKRKDVNPKQTKQAEGSSQSGRFEVAEVLAPMDEKTASDDPGIVLAILGSSSGEEAASESIRAAAASLELNVERAEDGSKEGRISDAFLEKIRSARLVVADLTDGRPDLYFALGYACCLNKSLISIAREGIPVRFQLKDWRHIPYTDASGLERDLRRIMESLLSEPATVQEKRD